MNFNNLKGVLGRSSVRKPGDSATSVKSGKSPSKTHSSAPSELSSRSSDNSADTASRGRFSFSSMLSRNSSPDNSSSSIPSVSTGHTSPASRAQLQPQVSTSTIQSDTSTDPRVRAQQKPQKHASAAPTQNAEPQGPATFLQTFEAQTKVIGAGPELAKAIHSFQVKDDGLSEANKLFTKTLTDIEMKYAKYAKHDEPPELIEKKAKREFMIGTSTYIQMHQDLASGRAPNTVNKDDITAINYAGFGAEKTAEILYNSIKANQNKNPTHVANS
jgi:hypothetical protein